MLVTMALFFAMVMASAPNVGEVAPDFTVKDIEGNELNLSKLTAQGNVVLAFFPKAFTPG